MISWNGQMLLFLLYYCFMLTFLSKVVIGACDSKKPSTIPEIKHFRYMRPASDTRPRVTLVAMFPINKNKDCNTLVEVKNYNGFQRMEAFLWALGEINSIKPGNRNGVFIEAMLYDSCSNKQHAISNVFHAKSFLDLEPDNLLLGVVGASYSSVTKPLSMVTAALDLPLVSYAATNNDLSAHPLFARTVWSDDVQAEAIEDILKYFKLKSVKTIGTQEDANSDGLRKKLQQTMEDHVNMCDTIKFPLNPGNKLRLNTTCDEDKENKEWKDFHEKAKHILESKMDAFIVAIKADTKKLFLKAIRCQHNLTRDNMHGDNTRQALHGDNTRQALHGDNTRQALQLIATDTWDISDNLQDIHVKRISRILNGSMTIVPDYDDLVEVKMRNHIRKVTDKDYIQRNTAAGDIPENQKNPWLDKIWRTISGCTSDVTKVCNYKVINNYFTLDTKLESVINTAVLYNLAITEYLKTSPRCSGSIHAARECVKKKNWITGAKFFNDFILPARGKGLAGDSEIALDCDGNSLPKYGIWQWKNEGFVKAGTWKNTQALVGGKRNLAKVLNHKPVLNWNDTNKVTLRPNYPKGAPKKDGTSCRPECKQGEKKILLQSQDELNDECCHGCKTLDPHEIFKEGKNEPCEPGAWPNADQDTCLAVKVEYKYEGSSAPGLAAIFISLIFLIITIFYGAILYWKRSHPAVAKSGVHFLPFIFAGACLCHLFNIFIFSVTLGRVSCLIIKFLSGLSPTFMFSALLIKTRKVYDIFIMTFQKDKRHANRDQVKAQAQDVCPGLTDAVRGISERLTPKKGKNKQIMRVWVLIMVEVFIIIVWSLNHAVNDASATQAIYPHNRNLHVCTTPAIEYFYIQVFNICLFILCTAYGYLGRNVPDDYNETRFISFSMFTVCMIWACGFFLMGMLRKETFDYTSKAHAPEILVAIFSVVMSFSAMAVVGIMLTNKVYIILKKEVFAIEQDQDRKSKVVYLRPQQKTRGAEDSITDTTEIKTASMIDTKSVTGIEKMETKTEEQNTKEETNNDPKQGKKGLLRELTINLKKRGVEDDITDITDTKAEEASIIGTKKETSPEEMGTKTEEQNKKDERNNDPKQGKQGLMRELTINLQKRKPSKTDEPTIVD